mmetsp:Transcript_3878/g.11281  ORF Transcript_3878/g.11281 Transcript_3878/m.11281 type:complete len:209 (+) Transcript_3878:822-1448(+)
MYESDAVVSHSSCLLSLEPCSAMAASSSNTVSVITMTIRSRSATGPSQGGTGTSSGGVHFMWPCWQRLSKPGKVNSLSFAQPLSAAKRRTADASKNMYIGTSSAPTSASGSSSIGGSAGCSNGLCAERPLAAACPALGGSFWFTYDECMQTMGDKSLGPHPSRDSAAHQRTCVCSKRFSIDAQRMKLYSMRSHMGVSPWGSRRPARST